MKIEKVRKIKNNQNRNLSIKVNRVMLSIEPILSRERIQEMVYQYSRCFS